LTTKYLYLLINLASLAVPLAFSFHPKLQFVKQWKFVLPSILISAMFFILWDEIFTRSSVWGFNPDYISGIYIFNLPIEEVLFFFCIPYACLFTYVALNNLIEKNYFYGYHELISSAIIIFCLIVGVYNLGRAYTAVTFLTTGVFLSWLLLKHRPRFMGRFYFAFFVLLIPFAIVNGILTGSFLDEPIVWYNNDENLSIRFFTIPVEDFFYALLMILVPITISEKLSEVYPKKLKASLN
jgi:lycopene cyclase domain-containing protein